MTRLRVLWALPSTDRLHSAAGTASLELAAQLARTHTVELAVDDSDPGSVAALGRFCEAHELALHVGHGSWSPRAPDPVNLGLAPLLAGTPWDVVQCGGWANAATNAAVFAGAGRAAVVYAPHDPATRTPTRRLSVAQRAGADAAHAALLARADAVLCDSPAHRRRLSDAAPAARLVDFPPAVDLDRVALGEESRDGSALMVIEPAGDVAPRFDLVAAAVLVARRWSPTLRLVTVDRTPGAAAAPELAGIAEQLGPVGERELHRRYASASALLYPYPGAPCGYAVLEALASGTAAVVADGPDLRSLHGAARAVCFVDLADAVQAGWRLARTIASRTHIAAIADRDKLRRAFGLAERVSEHDALLRNSVAEHLAARHELGDRGLGDRSDVRRSRHIGEPAQRDQRQVEELE